MKAIFIIQAACIIATGCVESPPEADPSNRTKPFLSGTSPGGRAPATREAEVERTVTTRRPKRSQTRPPLSFERIPGYDGRPMLLSFSRDHCLPCELMEPWLKNIKETYHKKVDVKEVNLDREDNLEYARLFSVMTVPTLVYLDKAGRERGRHFGLATEKQMTDAIERHLRLAAPSGAASGNKR